MNFGEKRDSLMQKLVKLTQSAKFLQPSENAFLRSDRAVSKALDNFGDLVLETINKTFEFTSKKVALFDGIDDVQDSFGMAVDLMDNLFEKADILLESTKKEKQKIKFQLNANQKPQLSFKDKIDNSNTNWTPIIKYKPNAKVPLGSQISPEMTEHMSNFPQNSVQNAPCHPYEYEIMNLEYPNLLFTKAPEIMSSDIQNVEPIWVDSLDGLEKLCQELSLVKLFAVDLEHHDTRTYLGFTCLIQISTRSNDYLIDALALRSELHALNDTFTDPTILKVFHGAEMDIQWLQRDFGVYVVNLFDTFHASHLLQTEKHSLSHLLEIYCNVKADKRFQLSDWRRRPLTEAMIRYAQSDTHYLLYIFDVMRNQLLDFTSAEFPNAMKEVLLRSQQTSLIQYTKPIYDAENGKGKGGWLSIIQKCAEPLNEENVAVLRAIHGWRDHIARQEDESTHYILPKHMLLNLAKIMPITAKDLIMQCNPTPAFIKLYSVELAKLIEDALESTRAGQKNVEKKYVTNVVKDKSDQFNTRISIEKREIKHKMDISSSKTSQLFGNIYVNSETQNFNGRVTLKIASFPDVEEHVPEQLVDNEETTPIKSNLLDKLATPHSNTSSPKRHLEFEEPQESKKKAKPIPENFKPFSYSDKNVEMGETEKKFFDPMSDYQKHNSKVLDSIDVENKLEK